MVKLKIASLELEIKKKKKELQKYDQFKKYFVFFYREEKYNVLTTSLLLLAVLCLLFLFRYTEYPFLDYFAIAIIIYCFFLWRTGDHYGNTMKEIIKLEEELNHYRKHAR